MNPDAGLDPQREARQALESAVRDYGPRVLGNPSLLSNLFKDLLPGSPREASLLVAAAEGGTASMLEQQVAGVGPDSAVRAVSHELAESRALEPSACLWAVGEFARAMGYPVTEGLQPSIPDSGATLPWAGPVSAAPGGAMMPPAPVDIFAPSSGPPSGPPTGPTGPPSGPPFQAPDQPPEPPWAPGAGGPPVGPPAGIGPMGGRPPAMGPGGGPPVGPPPGMGPQPSWSGGTTPPRRRGGMAALIAAAVVIVVVIVYIAAAAAAKLPPFTAAKTPTPAPTTTPSPHHTPTPSPSPSPTAAAVAFNVGNNFDFQGCSGQPSDLLGITDPDYDVVTIVISCLTSDLPLSNLYSDFHDGDYFLSGTSCTQLSDCLPDYLTTNGSCSDESSSDFVDGNVVQEQLCDLSSDTNAPEDYVLFVGFSDTSDAASYYMSLLSLNGMASSLEGTCSSTDLVDTSPSGAMYCQNTYTVGSSSSSAGDLFEWTTEGNGTGS